MYSLQIALQLYFSLRKDVSPGAITHHRYGSVPVPFTGVPVPFLDRKVPWATLRKTSSTNRFPGCWGSIVRQRTAPSTQKLPATHASMAPNRVIATRGGNDFFSGKSAGSNISTLGVSFASSTFANSYS